MNITPNQLLKFWDWFTIKSSEIFDYKISKTIIVELDDKVRLLGDFSWEIGDYDAGRKYLAISPNLNKDKLLITTTIIEAAPKLSNWVFIQYRQPKKEWLGIFEMLNQDGDLIKVDVKNWLFIIYEFDDNSFDVEVFLDKIDGDEKTVNSSVQITIINLIGEERAMRYIVDIDWKYKDFETPSKGLNFNQFISFFNDKS